MPDELVVTAKVKLEVIVAFESIVDERESVTKQVSRTLAFAKRQPVQFINYCVDTISVKAECIGEPVIERR